MGFLGGSVVKNPPVNAGNPGDTGSIPGSGRSLGGVNGTLVFLPEKFHGQKSLAATVHGQKSLAATVHGVTKNQT